MHKQSLLVTLETLTGEYKSRTLTNDNSKKL